CGRSVGASAATIRTAGWRIFSPYGGCRCSWRVCGDQAIYVRRGEVKIFGEPLFHEKWRPAVADRGRYPWSDENGSRFGRGHEIPGAKGRGYGGNCWHGPAS